MLTVMLTSFRKSREDSWKDYPTAFNVEWFLHLKLQSIGKPPKDALILKLPDALPPESIHSKVLARLEDERKPPSLKHPEAHRLLQKSLEFEQKVIRKLQKQWGLFYDHYFQEKRLWLKDDSGKRMISGLCNVLLIPFNQQYGIILQYYFTHLTPPSAEKSKELEILAVIAHKHLKLKKIFANSLWVPNDKLTTVIYPEERLTALYQQLQIDLKAFHNC